MIKKIAKAALIAIAVLTTESAMSQITLQCVKPGQQVMVAPENDTLWIMNDYRMRKVVETGRLYKLEKEKTELLNQKCDTLNQIITQKDELIATIKEDRRYYEVELKDCREDSKKAAEMAKKYQKRARIATIGCAVAAGVGFLAGAVLIK